MLRLDVQIGFKRYNVTFDYAFFPPVTAGNYSIDYSNDYN